MHAHMRADPGCTNMPTPEAASPLEIEVALDRLACYIKTDTEADMLGLWATSSLASKLGLTVALSSSTDPVEIVRDLGNTWAAEFGRGLDDVSPAGVPDVLRAAQAAIQQVVEEVRVRGLAG